MICLDLKKNVHKYELPLLFLVKSINAIFLCINKKKITCHVELKVYQHNICSISIDCAEISYRLLYICVIRVVLSKAWTFKLVIWYMLRLAAELTLPDLKKLGCEIDPPSQLFFLDSAAMLRLTFVIDYAKKLRLSLKTTIYSFSLEMNVHFIWNGCIFHWKLRNIWWWWLPSSSY